MLVDTLTIATVKKLANQRIAELAGFVSECIRSGRYKGIENELRLIKEIHQGVEYLSDSTTTDDNRTTVASYLFKIGDLHNISTKPYTL